MGRFSSLVSAADLARRWCFDPTWWFPPACPCCGSPNVADAPCALCEARLFGAGTPPDTVAPDGTPVRAAAWFESDVRDVLHRLKFGRDTHAARAFPQRMAMVASDLIPTCDVVVPMPLSLRRRLLRGFNQAEVLAELLSEMCRLPGERRSFVACPSAPAVRHSTARPVCAISSVRSAGAESRGRA
jgi:predicted amidophosphoribosyltransferase